MKKFLKLLKLLEVILLVVLDVIVIYIISYKLGIIEYDFNLGFLEKKKTVEECINNDLTLTDDTLLVTTGEESAYYYDQLGDSAKVIYNKILKNKDKLKTGTAALTFKEGEFGEKITKAKLEEIALAYQDAVDALRYDHVELFYIDFTKMILKTITYTNDNEISSAELSLDVSSEESTYLGDNIEPEKVDEYIILADAVADQIIEEAEGTDYQKIQYIHNWLIDNLEYDTTYNSENNRNIYGALINRKVVCEGYSKAFKYILDKLEIPCILVSGYATNSEGTTESHMWNYVKINDTWYSFDVTWDDPILSGKTELPDESRYKYFCQGDNINSNHYLNNQITDGGRDFEYPELYHKED